MRTIRCCTTRALNWKMTVLANLVARYSSTAGESKKRQRPEASAASTDTDLSPDSPSGKRIRCTENPPKLIPVSFSDQRQFKTNSPKFSEGPAREGKGAFQGFAKNAPVVSSNTPDQRTTGPQTNEQLCHINVSNGEQSEKRKGCSDTAYGSDNAGTTDAEVDEPPAKRPAFDIFRDFLENDAIGASSSTDAAASGPNNGYASMWFCGEPAPPPQ